MSRPCGLPVSGSEGAEIAGNRGLVTAGAGGGAVTDCRSGVAGLGFGEGIASKLPGSKKDIKPCGRPVAPDMF